MMLACPSFMDRMSALRCLSPGSPPLSGKKNAKQCKRLSLVYWMEIWIRAPHITPNDMDCKGCPERQNQWLVWTMEKPKAPGWYWYHRYFSSPRIVQLMYRGLDTDRLVVSFAGNEENEWVEDMVGWWAGPIHIPEEAVS